MKNKENILEEKKREKRKEERERRKKRERERRKENHVLKKKTEKTEKRPDFLFGKSDLYVLKSQKKILSKIKPQLEPPLQELPQQP